MTDSQRYELRELLWKKFHMPCGERDYYIGNFIYIYNDSWFTDDIENKFQHSKFKEIKITDLTDIALK